MCVFYISSVFFDCFITWHAEAASLQSLCVLQHPLTPPPATSTTLHEYDTSCLQRLTSLSSVTLPIPTHDASSSGNLLTAFQNLQYLDISKPFGAPAPQQKRSQRTRLPPAQDASVQQAFSSLPKTIIGSLKTLVATLPAAAAASSGLTHLTALRLCGALESEQRGMMSHLSVLTGLQSLALSSPVAWATKSPGALRQHCLLYTSPSPRDRQKSRMPSSA